MNMLAETLERINSLDEKPKAALIKQAIEATKHMAWIPSPGPQTDAYHSKADVLLYGGEPGGGKSSLLLGLALNKHRRSLIMRRQYTDLGHLLEEAQKFNGGKEGFNGSPPPKLKRPDGKVIDFGAAAKVGDEQHWQGNPHDLIGIDESTQFAEIQIRFLMGWLRCADDPNQRKRVVLATNPPLSAEGLWCTEWFAPWLDDKFPNPAKQGELRYAVLDTEDKHVWVDGSDPVWMADRDKFITPKSYTYINASVDDNPFLSGTDYDKELDSMPEEIRSVLMGGFKTSFRDAPNQIIPTEWVRLAQQRWRSVKPDGIPMCAMAADCTGGGTDPLVIAKRHDGWYAPLVVIPAKEIPKDRIGHTTTGHIISHRRNSAVIIIDMGGGYGGSTYEILKENELEVLSYKGSEATTRRSRDGKLQFTNIRSAALWQFREALDPDQPGGSPIRLPPGSKVMGDLTAPTYKVTPNGIRAEPKEDVCKRLGRSTDDGDAVMMCWFYGDKVTNSALEWIERKERKSKRGQAPKVLLSRNPRTGRR